MFIFCVHGGVCSWRCVFMAVCVCVCSWRCVCVFMVWGVFMAVCVCVFSWCGVCSLCGVYVCAYVCVCVYERALTTGVVGEVLPLHTEACFLARLSGLSEHRAGDVRESSKSDVQRAAS